MRPRWGYRRAHHHLIDDWREDYNRRRPHSSLGMRTPDQFAAQHAARA